MAAAPDSTQVRKVEPIGGDIVRLYFAVPRDGAWEDQCTVLMSMTALPDALGLAITSAREIAAQGQLLTIPRGGWCHDRS
jgi:hypothetical protein